MMRASEDTSSGINACGQRASPTASHFSAAMVISIMHISQIIY
jgi:hypothetical protein